MSNYLITQNSTTTDISNTSLGSYVSANRLFDNYQYIRDFSLQSNLYGIGENNRGQLGLNDGTPRSSALFLLGSGVGWVSISSDSLGTHAIKSDGTLWGWGSNEYGQVGNNTSNFLAGRSSPTQIGSDTNWLMVERNLYSTIAIKTDGTIWSWGHNYLAQLGYGPPSFSFGSLSNNISSPTQIGTDNKWVSVKGNGGGHGVNALKSDGTLWKWGLDINGITVFSSPTQIGSSRDWSKLVDTYAVIDRYGTLWIWGQNYYGGFGDSTSDYYTTRGEPVQLGTERNWKSVIRNATSATGVKTDGTLWAWAGSFLNEPSGPATARSSPVQIGTSNDWANIFPYNMAIKADGTLWGWGDAVGFTGYRLGVTGPESSPVLFGSWNPSRTDWANNWVSVSYTNLGFVGIKDETFFG